MRGDASRQEKIAPLCNTFANFGFWRFQTRKQAENRVVFDPTFVLAKVLL
jgi:hypothetical protein